MSVEITVKELAARCQVFYRKIYVFFTVYDAVRHVSYIAVSKTHFQENTCFCNYALTKYLSEVNLKIRRLICLMEINMKRKII